MCVCMCAQGVYVCWMVVDIVWCCCCSDRLRLRLYSGWLCDSSP